MANNSVNLHRVFAAPVEKLFKAFVNADAIPTEMCYSGRQESLDKLKCLAESNIPEA